MRRFFKGRRPRSRSGLIGDIRSATMMEFAVVGPFFLSFLFLIFEVAYDMFLQEVLETTLEQTAHEVQIGNAQNVTTGPAFVQNEFCPNDLGLLNCNDVYLRIERFESAATTTCSDLFGATSGILPATFSGNAWTLQLGNFNGVNGAGTGSDIGPSTSCISTTSAAGFCNAGPNQTIIMSAIYIAPSFLTALLPANLSYRYGGKIVRAPYATFSFQSEIFSLGSTASGAASQC